jgi:hypothetical protein
MDVAAWGGAIWVLPGSGQRGIAWWNGAWHFLATPRTAVDSISVVSGQLWAAGSRGHDAVLLRVTRRGARTVGRVRIPGEAFAVNDLDGSETDVWLVGSRADYRNDWRFVLRWDGRMLKRVRLSPLGLNSDDRYQSSLETVTVLGKSAAWAFGYDESADNLLAERWDGRRWRVLSRRFLPPLPREASINETTRTGSSRLWAVGGVVGILSEPAGGLVLRSDGVRWQRVAVPFFHASLMDVVATRTSLWVVGADAYSPSFGEPGLGVVLSRGCP